MKDYTKPWNNDLIVSEMQFSDTEGGRWVTINGAHIFIKDGEDVETAISKAFGKSTDPDLVDVYHGTLSRNVEGIKKDGIVGGKDVNYDLSKSPRQNQGKVYVTTDPIYAKHFAIRASQQGGTGNIVDKPVIIHARIPRSEVAKMSADPENIDKANLMTDEVKKKYLVKVMSPSEFDKLWR